MKSLYYTERAGDELRVSYTYTAGRPGVHTLPNGDPGYPDEPDELEISKIELQWSFPDDLSPDPRARSVVWLDVTELLFEIGGSDFADQLDDEIRNRLDEEAASAEPEHPEPDPDYPETIYQGDAP